ncbi:hypothetical protein TPB0596_12160 [Tsukamurella pulmonis]|uniref:hypothetical protein n=1 Tax=Tsukamurella pulmonis TaxID=47312 RepID=UPI001EDF62DA|nr:hypothetical protein [Tsukamurella pulmonis]BDD81453.1 hypothetical protein TPB0596_12160 [Tsukamurella pulmonis]
MSTFDTTGIGRAHVRLQTTADQLLADEHQELAQEYNARATVEATICADLTRLGEEAKRQRAIVDDDLHVGVELAAFLVRKGWTPPAHFNGRITE